MPRTARSRSADGATMAALLPPSSSSVLPKRAATRGPTCAPIRSEPVALTSATRGSSRRRAALSRSVRTSWWTSAGAPTWAMAWSRIAEHASDVSGGQLGRLPDDGVAAHQRDGGVPGPHRGREVEGGDHRDDAARVPRLHQPMAGALRRHRAPVELTRQADGEVADVDHLLDLAEGLGADLAHLDGDEVGEILLVLLQETAEGLHEGPALGGGDRAPLQEGGLRPRDRVVDACGVGGRRRRTGRLR